MLTYDQTVILSRPFAKPFNEQGFPYVPQRSDERLILAFHGRSVTLQARDGERVILGRYHSSNQFQPTIDLSLHGGIESGTSRTHAAIFFSKGVWWLEDLGSSNGTWLNGKRLAPFMPVCLQSNGTLCLANLEVGVMLPGISNTSL